MSPAPAAPACPGPWQLSALKKSRIFVLPSEPRYGKPSQTTLACRYKLGREDFSQYSKSFEELWHNEKLCWTLLRT